MMGTVTSTDGTKIAFWRDGAGPPMLLVHGGICDHFAWYFVVPLLAQHFTVYTFDRRGRGGSGNSLPYSVEREVEDILAMLDAIGEPVHLVGHSAGGILALKAATRTENLRSLILYEPAYVVDGARERPAPEVLKAILSMLDAGDHDEVIRIAMRESVGMSEAEIAALESGPGWEHLCGVAEAVPHDWMLWEERLEAENVKTVRAPVLMLTGSESPMWLRDGAEAVSAAFPKAQHEVLLGQGHSAMITEPVLFAEAVIGFADSTFR
ncbi:MAG: alpha/beta hydrolase [Terracidiphilus sp.]|jgi:pimeloyl-ACP methyl ester carboxylesterase